MNTGLSRQPVQAAAPRLTSAAIKEKQLSKIVVMVAAILFAFAVTDAQEQAVRPNDPTEGLLIANERAGSRC